MTEAIQELFDAIKSDDTFGLTSMLNANPQLADAVNDNGVSAAMFALYYGRKESAHVVVRAGAKVDAFLAAALGDTVRLDKALAADPGVIAKQSADGWTPLHLAAYFGQKAAAQLLLSKGASSLARSTNSMNNHPIHAAAAGRSRDLVALLLEHGADVNATQHGGWTALHAAAQCGDVEMVKVLLANGADRNIRADNNQNALDLALGKGAQEVVDLLVE